MKRLAIFVVALILLAAGGGLTAVLTQNSRADSIPGAQVQTKNPEASVFMSTDWQAHQFFLLTGFIIFNLVGMGVTIALVIWFLSRQVASVSGKQGESSDRAVEPSGS